MTLYDRCGQLCLYADSPYFLRNGIPGIVGGDAAPAADRAVEETLARLWAGFDYRVEKVLLPQSLHARKIAALRCYSTEEQIFWDVDGRGLYGVSSLRHELYWVVTRRERSETEIRSGDRQ